MKIFHSLTWPIVGPILVLFALASCRTVGDEAELYGHRKGAAIGVNAGIQRLDDDFDPVDEPITFGAEILWPVSEYGDFQGMFGISTGQDDDEDDMGNDIDLQSTNYFLGLRKTFPLGDKRSWIYWGGGLAYREAEFEVDTVSELKDEELGFYVQLGAEYDVTDAMYVGADARLMVGDEFTDGDFEADSDALQLMFVVGWRF